MPELSCRTLFISDVHLGSRHCCADYLLTLLNSVTCARLYLVGDIIDLWAMRRGLYWLPSHTAVVERLLAMATDGTPIVYLPGNHDELLRPLTGRQFQGIEIRSNAVHETADGRRFYVSHGDEFDAAVRCHPLIQLLGGPVYEGLMTVNRGIHWLRRKTGRPYWSFAAFVKARMGNAAEYIRRFEAAAAHATAKRGLDGYIGGHIHKPNIAEINGITYCNDGDWVEHCTALVEDHDGRLRIIHWAEQVALGDRDRC